MLYWKRSSNILVVLVGLEYSVIEYFYIFLVIIQNQNYVEVGILENSIRKKFQPWTTFHWKTSLTLLANMQEKGKTVEEFILPDQFFFPIRVFFGKIWNKKDFNIVTTSSNVKQPIKVQYSPIIFGHIRSQGQNGL